jgi:hypothetical protein
MFEKDRFGLDEEVCKIEEEEIISLILQKVSTLKRTDDIKPDFLKGWIFIIRAERKLP